MNTVGSILKNFHKFTFVLFRTSTSQPIQYHGFEYYPRRGETEDTNYKPSKLFLVKRVKSMLGRNPEERTTLQRLNIDGKKEYFGHINIVKNIPEINALLWKVKHLIIIKPIRYTGELPKKSEYFGTYLRDTGELLITNRLNQTEQIEVTEKFHNEKKTFSRHYLKQYLNAKWRDLYYNKM